MYEPGSFEILKLEHDIGHDTDYDPDCLWCNGRISEFWRAVNLDDDD